MGELAELIDLGDFLDRMVGTYSGGMKRRLDLAAALVHNPEVLFLDEPTTGLDPVSRAPGVGRGPAAQRRSLGITIFLTTQYLEEADELARPGRHHRPKVRSWPRVRPSDLKKAVGSDLILVHVEGDTTEALDVLARVPGVQHVEAHGRELVITGRTSDLRRSVRSPSRSRGPTSSCVTLTLRTPTLDDVFLELTGTHIERNESGGGVLMTNVAATHSPATDDAVHQHAGWYVFEPFLDRRPRVAGRTARHRVGRATHLHRAVLLRGQHRDASE